MTDAEDHAAHESEVRRGQRFEFGQNWTNFLARLDESRIAEATASLRRMLGVETLEGLSFLDIGSGSGLFSLAARRLGARVHSFDYDPKSVACTRELRRRFFDGDPAWTVEPGSVLDADYVDGLGHFDIVYSWGVLHHTGEMWKALEHAEHRVAPGGRLFIAIYNDQGGASKRWFTIKRIYNRLPRALQPAFAFVVYLPLEIRSFLIHLVRREPSVYFRYITNYRVNRGMSWWHDKIDWIGGYPFEVAKPERIFDFYRRRGYVLETLVTNAGGLACNEYVFRRGPG
jgi:2-polyprenyl-3-methyl-5-hydroxy-6-metoxy-1,4-benzoquinol methylase